MADWKDNRNASLGYLGTVTGATSDFASETFLGFHAGNVIGSEVRMSDFMVEKVDELVVDDATPNGNSDVTFTLNFINAGSKFLSRVGNTDGGSAISTNWSWSDNSIKLTEQSGGPEGTKYFNIYDTGVVGSTTSATATVVWGDYYNMPAGTANGWGVAHQKTVTIQPGGGKGG